MFDEYVKIAEVLPQIIAIAALVTAITPSPVDNAVLLAVRKVLDILALNWGHAKNDPAATAKK